MKSNKKELWGILKELWGKTQKLWGKKVLNFRFDGNFVNLYMFIYIYILRGIFFDEKRLEREKIV